jgi:hypothetical protein
VALGRAGLTSRAGRTSIVCLGGPWFLLYFIPAYKIHNTTRGTLLVPKMCMKLVVYSSNF